MQLKDEFPTESDFNRFLKVLREKLPVTFRINENVPNYKNFLEKISQPNFIEKMISAAQETEKEADNQKGQAIETENKEDTEEKADDEVEGEDEINEQSISEQIKLLNVPWYPKNLVWEMSTFRHELKRNEAFKGLHKFIQQANDSGLLTRQELVSMLPPLLLDVQSSDVVFDMCAAPGN